LIDYMVMGWLVLETVRRTLAASLVAPIKNRLRHVGWGKRACVLLSPPVPVDHNGVPALPLHWLQLPTPKYFSLCHGTYVYARGSGPRAPRVSYVGTLGKVKARNQT
jgi:hypothetical protein